MDGAALLVIVPTYNERENLPAALQGIARHLPGCGIIVVDDASPDGTADLAEQLRGAYPGLRVLRRTAKTGLADAYREAFGVALSTDAAAVITMDADLSHDPAHLPQIAAALDDHDVVIGSRYIRGISIVHWPLSRLLLSYAGNWYARTVTRLPVRDCTAGFVGYRRRVLETLPWERVRSRGYAYTVEAKLLARQAGFSLHEVPIIFRERVEGASKMNGRIALEALWTIPRVTLANLLRR